MNPLDLAVVAAYVVGCTALGAWIGAGSKGLRGYFLGESNIPAWAVMISIVATETSAVTFLSVPCVAYRGDLTYLQLPLGYILARVVVAFLLLPSYFKGEIYTAYQVLERRFGGATQKAASLLFLATRNLGSGLRLLLAAKFLQVLTQWNLETSILVIGVSTLGYTYLGGIKAVVWTDVIQFAIYLVGALWALSIVLDQLSGGLPMLWERALGAGKLRVFNFAFELKEPYTFWAGVIGGLVLDTGTHGADQMMVQRYLSARSERQAAAALIVSGFVILVQFALFLGIGVALWALYQDTPPATKLGTDQEFAYFLAHYLPVGVRGLVIAAVFSVTMSTLSGGIASSASSTVNDLYRPLAPATEERSLLRLSKGLTALWAVVDMGIALGAIGLKDNVVNNALAVASFVTGILLGLFLLGILTKNVGQTSALIGTVAGIAAVSAVKFATPVAWPWYALVGSSTVVAVAMLAHQLVGLPGRSATHRE
jgi:SSS family transporter